MSTPQLAQLSRSVVSHILSTPKLATQLGVATQSTATAQRAARRASTRSDARLGPNIALAASYRRGETCPLCAAKDLASVFKGVVAHPHRTELRKAVFTGCKHTINTPKLPTEVDA